MQPRKHLTHYNSQDRLETEADKLRKQAEGMPHGIYRDEILRKARQAETASHTSEWLNSPGLQPPK
jgi:hypothetical protein